MSPPSGKAPIDPLSFPLKQYPAMVVDYAWVITIYLSLSFCLAVLIDGYLLPPFDPKTEAEDSSAYLWLKISAQLAMQGFIAIFLAALVQKIPSPVAGVFDYDPRSLLGVLVRNPAIISVMLFALSSSLRARLMFLFSRFNNNVSRSA
jgi:hypothetical protein